MALIDSAGNTFLSDNLKEKHSGRLLSELRKLGSRQIRYMINTHFHDDHCGGNMMIDGAPIIAHVNTRKMLETDHVSVFWQDTSFAFPEAALPDITFTDNMTIYFGGEEIELTHFPNGHTHSDIIVYFKKSKVLHLSDLLFSIGFPAIDAERGGNVFRFADHLKSILDKYPDDLTYVAGHGNEFSKSELTDYQAMITGSALAVKTAMKNGQNMQQIKQSKILDKWKQYSKGYFSCDDWAEILFENLRWSDTLSEYFDLSCPAAIYIDLVLPGAVPSIFAPGIISTQAYEGCSGFGKGLKEFIFQRWLGDRPVLFQTQFINGKWAKPITILNESQVTVYDFTISPDGSRMVFASSAQIESLGKEQSGHNLFRLERTKSGWNSSPVPYDSGINTRYHDSYPSISSNGNLYFFSNRPGGYGKGDIYYSEFRNGQYLQPKNLGDQINTAYEEWDPFIAPDESYLIFCSKKLSGEGEDDLYVSFKNSNGTWNNPKSFGNKINTPSSENRPYVTPDGKYLFYTRNITRNRDIYWVSTKIFEELRPL